LPSYEGRINIDAPQSYAASSLESFYHPKSNNPAGEGRFIHLWQYKNGSWKITRVISYDHHAAK
jgi:hypothetical protein